MRKICYKVHDQSRPESDVVWMRSGRPIQHTVRWPINHAACDIMAATLKALP